MKIFNIQVFGIDAERFCKKTKEQQFDWIKQNTNQQNDEIINEFLSKPFNKTDDCGCGCGGNKTKTDVASGISEKIANDNKPPKVTGNSSGTNTKGRDKPKATKGSGL